MADYLDRGMVEEDIMEGLCWKCMDQWIKITNGYVTPAFYIHCHHEPKEKLSFAERAHKLAMDEADNLDAIVAILEKYKKKPKCWCEVHRFSLENARIEMQSRWMMVLNFCPECGKKLE